MGGNSITAVYSGDANYSTTTSAAITLTLLSPLVTFGSSNVGTAAAGQTLNYTFTSAATLTAVNILTLGASGQDYTDGGSSTCTATAYTAGQSCVVTVALTPTAPGARAGAVTLFAQGSNLPLMTWYLSGVGNSGAVTIDPGTLTTTTLTGTLPPAGYGSAVDGAGNVYVVDHANNAVLKLAAGTFSQSTVVSALSGPTGVALDGAGDLYISNDSSVVMVPNENGTLNAADQSTVNLSGLGSARGVAVDANGDLYVADATNGDVVELSSLGVQTTIASGLTSPHGIAVDAALNVYVATDNAVTQYPHSGGTGVPYGTGYNNPRGVAVDAAGAVYVADTGNNQIVRVSPGGGSQTTLTVTGVSSPQGVSVDASDNLYVTDPSIVIQVNRTQAAQLNFPTTNVGSTSATQVVTVTDAGNEALQVSNLAISTNFASEPSGGTDCTSSTNLSAGGQCEIGVAFKPTVSGALTGTVSLSDNALNITGSTQTVPLSGGGSQVAQTITFTANAPASAAYGSQFTVAATASSGLPVIFTSAGVCSNVGATYTMTSGTGACSVIANQAGNTEYSAAPQVTQTVNATLASQTITFSTNAPASAAYGSHFTVAAAASSGLPVVFTSSGTCSNVGATYTMTNGTGACSVIANQAGNSQYSAAPQVTQTTNATLASQTITFPAPASPAPYNSSFAVSATSTSGLTVTITPSGVCSILSGTVTMTSGTGTCTLTASQSGNPDYSAAANVVHTVTATLATPAINWATPAAITYGPALSATQLDATATYNGASVAGTFVYSPAKGTVLGAGSQTLSVTFTPTITADYTSATASVILQVNQAVPKITWAKPAVITYGAALSGTQLDATASVAGTFVYSPPAGTILTAGTQTLSVTFTPTDTVDYATTNDAVTITVNKAAPSLTWATPAPITYGTALSKMQLDATASVAGTFVYSPAAGAIPAGGTDTLKVTFTPTDTTDYTTGTTSVTLQVNGTAPTINWSTPAPITYGTALSATQLDATATYNGASVAGTFVYTPAKGTVLTAWSQTLSVTFTPSNTANYTSASASISLQVNQATPKITWAKPAAITYPTPLSSTQLDATASIPGTFTYSPAPGTVLAAGTQTLSVTFTPTDTTDYTTATASVTITVKP